MLILKPILKPIYIKIFALWILNPFRWPDGAVFGWLAKIKKHPWRFIVGFFVVTIITIEVSNPLRWPNTALHHWLLWEVPVGSDFNHLQTIGLKKGWQVGDVQVTNPISASLLGLHLTKGSTIAIVYLGHYQSLLRADLVSYWTFDEKGHLIDVEIRRGYDGP